MGGEVIFSTRYVISVKNPYNLAVMWPGTSITGRNRKAL
jgi:hypothetical protein